MGSLERGGLLLPGAARTAVPSRQAAAPAPRARRPPHRPSLALGSECDSLAAVIVRTYQWSDDGGTMPGKSSPFTARVEPVSPPCPPLGGGGGAGHCPR